MSIVVLRDRPVASNQTADFLNRYPNRIDVYDDESVGSTLATAPALLLPQQQVELSVSGPAAELVELSRKSGELRLRKSLRSFASQTLCVQLQARTKEAAKSAQSLTEASSTEKTVCIHVKRRPQNSVLPTIHWPLPNSVHRFREVSLERR